ncbi:hypothetical protein HAX54_009380 [Datura stramonium]|uniref:Plant heme peroxidase family profile domain-containing protein n=1 Tax=Datura stramonium TaxID=4076 RepID=A0ABS8RXY4_DATST|nr:hypothetical protein [Datura stramonium]
MCAGVAVSCADILALAARDSVAMLGGMPYPVNRPKRRKDREFHRRVNPTPGPVRRSQRPIKEIQRQGVVRPGNGRVGRVPHGGIREMCDIMRRQKH